jgi:hypothetical protein
MGAQRPLTFGPDEMTRLKDIVLGAKFDLAGGGSYHFVENFPARYIADLTNRPKLKRRLKVVAACGNGTAGAFSPRVLEAIGCDVVPLDCSLDHLFPRYNPNPEDMAMLHAIRDVVLANRADVGLGFDGDGDRCGVVDDEGEEIFADKVGVMLARDMSSLHKGAKFVVDVKSTGLFATVIRCFRPFPWQLTCAPAARWTSAHRRPISSDARKPVWAARLKSVWSRRPVQVDRSGTASSALISGSVRKVTSPLSKRLGGMARTRSMRAA